MSMPPEGWNAEKNGDRKAEEPARRGALGPIDEDRLHRLVTWLFEGMPQSLSALMDTVIVVSMTVAAGTFLMWWEVHHILPGGAGLWDPVAGILTDWRVVLVLFLAAVPAFWYWQGRHMGEGVFLMPLTRLVALVGLPCLLISFILSGRVGELAPMDPGIITLYKEKIEKLERDLDRARQRVIVATAPGWIAKAKTPQEGKLREELADRIARPQAYEIDPQDPLPVPSAPPCEPTPFDDCPSTERVVPDSTVPDPDPRQIDPPPFIIVPEPDVGSRPGGDGYIEGPGAPDTVASQVTATATVAAVAAAVGAICLFVGPITCGTVMSAAAAKYGIPLTVLAAAMAMGTSNLRDADPEGIGQTEFTYETPSGVSVTATINDILAAQKAFEETRGQAGALRKALEVISAGSDNIFSGSFTGSGFTSEERQWMLARMAEQEGGPSARDKVLTCPPLGPDCDLD